MVLDVQDSEVVFRSVHHPGSSPSSLIFARNLVLPLATCMLPVMVVTLVDVLQGRPALPYLLVGFPIAALVAIAWTAYRLRTTPAEIVVRSGRAEIRSILEVAGRMSGSPDKLVLDLRKSRNHFELALGTSSYELADSEWPDLQALLGALQDARQLARSIPPTDPRIMTDLRGGRA